MASIGRLRPVIVWWDDPHTMYGWENKETVREFADRPVCRNVSCGFLLKRDRNGVTVLQSENAYAYSEATKIDMALIRKIVLLSPHKTLYAKENGHNGTSPGKA